MPSACSNAARGFLPLQVYVLKRPHVDEFLQRMGQLFECVLFTASLAKVRPAPAPSPQPLHPTPVRQTAFWKGGGSCFHGDTFPPQMGWMQALCTVPG